MAQRTHTIPDVSAGATNVVMVLTVGAQLVKASDGSLMTNSDANVPNAAIAMSDTGHANDFVYTIPAGLAAASVQERAYQKAGGSLARSDLQELPLSVGAFDWDGSAEASIAALATAAALTALSNKVGTPAGASIAADIAGIDSGGGTGTGDVLVDHDYGGTDALRVLHSGSPIDGATLYAYEADAYGASATPDAQTFTGSDGRWVAPMHLDAGDYKLVVSKPGTIVDKMVDLTVA